jgi:CMP/dCMP kinase
VVCARVAATVPSPPVAADTSRDPDRQLVVAVDGPSGSGKSSVCRAVATEQQLRYLDTGAMYRAVTWLALQRGMDLRDEQAVAAIARDARLDLTTDPSAPAVRVNGIDVTSAIRESRISAAVSAVATNLDVRAELVRRQQAVIADPDAACGIVVEGRDITTVVAPEASVRILLTASADARVARRAKELHGTVDDRTVAATSDEVLRRDEDDSTVVEFRRAADGVVVIDTSALAFNDVVNAVLELIVAARTGRPTPVKRQ